MHLRRIALVAASAVLLVGCAELRVTAEPTPAPIVGRSTTIVATTVNGRATDDITISENGTVLKRCNDSLACRLDVRSDVVGPRTFEVAVWRGDSTRPEATATLVVRWQEVPDFEVTLRASQASAPVGTVVVLTATASADVGPTENRVVIQEDFERSTACASGTRCALRVRHDEPGRHTFLATIEDDRGAVAAMSEPLEVVWVTTTTTTTTTVPTDPGGGGHVPPP